MHMLNQLTLAIFILAGIIHIHNAVAYIRGRAPTTAFYWAVAMLPLVFVMIYRCLT
jgi:hypothetical protein